MVSFSGLTIPHVTQIQQQKTRTFYEVAVPNRYFDYRADLGGQGDTFTVNGWLQSADATQKEQISALVGATGILDLQEPTYKPFDAVSYAQIVSNPNQVTPVNGPTIDLTQSPPFGTGAGKFVGANTQYLSIPNSPSFNFSGDFTIDFLTKYVSDYDIIGTHYGTGFLLDTESGYLKFYIGNPSVWTAASALSTNTWHHVAIVRHSGTLNGAIDGVFGTGVSNSTSISSTYPLTIGDDLGDNGPWTGWLKEVRISNVARWTSNFTPPASEYTPDIYTALLLHMDSGFTDSAGGSFYTNDTGAAYVKGSPFTVLAVSTDLMYFGFHNRWNLMQFIFSMLGSYSNIYWEYSQGSGSWNLLSGYTDGTNGFSQNGAFSFTPPSDWAQDTVGGVANCFWLRVGALNITTTATINQVLMNPCYQCILQNPLYTFDPTVWDLVTYQLILQQVENPFTPTLAAAGFDPLGFNSTGFSV